MAMRIGEMTFPHPGRSAHQQILMALDEDTGGQVLDQGAIDPRGSREVEMSQGFVAVASGERRASIPGGVGCAVPIHRQAVMPGTPAGASC